jgi:signal transduction histidine kinase
MRTVAWARSHAADLLDALIVAVLGGTSQYEVWVGPLFQEVAGPRLANAVLLALMCAPLLWRRSHPTLVFAVVLLALAVQSEVEVQAGVVARSDQGTLQGWVVALIAFYSLAAYATPRRAAVAGLLGGAGWIADDLRELLPGTIALEDTIPAWFILAAAWGMGYALHGRQAEVSELTDRADRLEREREAAVATERARIARDLHDVVAHSLSVMIVQAQAAERVLEGKEASAREALASIDATGRQAMVEMRRLVGMLRDHDEPSLAPRPGLGQLPSLVEQMRDAGLPVDVEVRGEPRPLAPGVDLSAYRIVQEALTNALRHAGPARARVVVRFDAHELQLEVSDDGRGADGGDGGHGLVGMRERVALYGGDLESGSRNGRGFTVRAKLPA